MARQKTGLTVRRDLVWIDVQFAWLKAQGFEP